MNPIWAGLTPTTSSTFKLSLNDYNVMANILFVPVHLDALFLDKEQSVSAPMADFSKLPYFDGSKDINPDTANLSESIRSVPFQNQNINLNKGLHLHWSLPDGLTAGGAGGTADNDPAVPNRWLITRRNNIGNINNNNDSTVK